MYGKLRHSKKLILKTFGNEFCSERYRAQVTQVLDNKAPVEQAGIKLDLDRNEIENLIKPASKLK